MMMPSWTILLVSLIGPCLTRRTEDDIYLPHLYSSYLNSLGGHHSPYEGSNFKVSEEDKFYYEGAYSPHAQKERAAKPVEIESYVTPLPPVYESRTGTTSANPYTYAVTGGAVTPALAYHGSPTPSHYHGAPTHAPYRGAPTPSPYHGAPTPSPYHGAPTPSPYHGAPTPSPYHRAPTPAPYAGFPSSATFHGSPTPAPHYGSPSPAPHYGSPTPSGHHAPPAPGHSYGLSPSRSYPHPPIPTHSPAPYSPYPGQPTGSPIYYGSPSPYHRPSPSPFSLVEEPLPSVHHPPRRAQSASRGTTPAPQQFLGPVHPTPFSFQPLGDPVRGPVQHAQLQGSPAPAHPTSDAKPAITFLPSQEDDYEEYEEYEYDEYAPEDFTTVADQKPRGGRQFSPQPIFGQQQQQVVGFAGDQVVRQVVQPQRAPPPQFQQFPAQQQQFQPQQQQSLFQPQQFQLQAHELQPQRQQFQPQQDRFQPQQQFQPNPQENREQFQQLEPQANIEQTESLFTSINKPAVERAPRRQLVDLSKMKHMTKNDALARLLDVAGADWDLSQSIHNNLAGGPKESDYKCPTPEGHFPDTERCNVYYQCANGIATKQSCGAGLKYNVLTNQCDWEASVDCSLNRDPRMLNQHSGPTPRPLLTPTQQAQFRPQQPFQQQQQQNLPFSKFFRV